jgi:Cdc6-like AAA superfamily ATPase
MRKEGHDPQRHKRARRFGHLGKTERIALTEKVFIRYPRLKELYAKIDFCRTFSKNAAEPECMLISGKQGAGKTTLTEWYAGDFPVSETPERRIVPVLVITVPSPATVKGFASEVLQALGDPAADKGTVSSITLRVRKYLKDCEVELIILDEFQHFDDRQSKNVLKTISDWLKNLLNQTGIPIVLVGMPGCESVLEAKGNEQLKRRFSSREKILPFGWTTPQQTDEFRQLLKMIDDDLPLLKDSHLAETSIAFLIHSATEGVINYVMKLLRRAAALAIEWGREQIDLPILAHAYATRLEKDFKNRPNPFGHANQHPYLSKSAKRAAAPGAMSRRLKSQKRKPSMSDVLKSR